MNIVFDFDGTIVDSLEALYGLNATVAKTLLNRELSREQYRAAFNGSFHGGIAHILSLSHEEDQIFRAGKKYVFETHYSPTTVSLFDGISEVLHCLDPHTLSILTAAPKEVVWGMLRHHGIDGLFARVMSSEESGKCEWLKSLTKPTMFVTDTVGDVIEGKQADAKVIGVSWGFHDKVDLLAAGADVVLDEVNQLSTLA